ncbi:MAG: DUF72 domain-containing protein [Candidatus Brockarchaeota archaeon]|nr:DUF72 domain-containing protein [Candidatus Brockarchaeota archaeon]
MTILLGCSGWSYEEWVGPFYPGREKKFSYYSRIFKAVEIDSTFYKYPTSGMVLGLARSSPRDFVFTAKFPKLITHELELEPGGKLREGTERFLQLMRPLNTARKIGALLIQLPPSFKFKSFENLAAFLEGLPTDLRYAVEFRHPSWLREETWALLRKHGVAYTIVDEPLLPPDVHVTADFAYVRWHGRGSAPWFDYRYTDDQLEEWVPKLEEVRKKAKETYGMFNNHFRGYAPENCLRIMEMLGAATPQQVAVRKRITEYIDGAGKHGPKLSLPGSLGRDEKPGRVERLLEAVMDSARLRRAREIPAGQVVLEEASKEAVRGRVKDYGFAIYPVSREVVHDCGDWGKGLGQRRLCKHLGAALLAMPSEVAQEILESLEADRMAWTFRTVEGR